MKNKHIAIFIPTLAGGGAEKAMLSLAEGLLSRGYMVDLLIKQKYGALISDIPDSLNVINFNVPVMRNTLRPLRQYIKKKKPDVLISALNLSNLVAILGTRMLKRKPRVIITVHGLISREEVIYQKLLDRVLFGFFFPQADRIVGVSEVCVQDMISYLHLPESKVKVIYNPILDAEFDLKVDQPFRIDRLLEENKKIILNIGRLEPVKDHYTLLQAFKLIRNNFDARLIILGEGPLEGQIRDWVKKMDLIDQVLLPGYVQNLPPIFSKADLLVNASLRESFSNVIVEAMACGCPIVSTACGGPEEILDYGNFGHLVPIGDAQSMAIAIEKVFNGEQRLPPQGWLEQFRKDVNVEKYIDLIEA